eukprot:TRINITY_DN6882_c0_g1_i2.p1 TRINITY_DN6882_c0_g1~~TRINITY_DN6882_c0_g1_i2.p1  ORF type:complete len:287 (+),score=33.39 TRINITY_DN6882_c0_g1_i2:868-1728(+)
MIDFAKEAIKTPSQPLEKMFDIGNEIGRTPTAAVWTGVNLTTKKKVAIKIASHTTEEEKICNYSEISTLLRCSHPNIVALQSVWDASQFGRKPRVWIVTELLEGMNLAKTLKTVKFSEQQSAFVTREVLNAVYYLHQFGYAHRNVCPDNIIVMSKAIKLVDFGYCCNMSTNPRVEILGSPYWIAPEMTKGEPHDQSVDIWSLAVCTLEMLTGKPPYNGSALNAMFRIATMGLKDLIPKDISSECTQFLQKCFEMNPAKRPSAGDLLKYSFVSTSGLEKSFDLVFKN